MLWNVGDYLEIDYTRTYRVILNHLPWASRPTAKTLKSLRYYLPNAVVLGFGYYDHYKFWYLIVSDPTFPVNYFSTMGNMSWSQATGANLLKMTQGTEPRKV